VTFLRCVHPRASLVSASASPPNHVPPAFFGASLATKHCDTSGTMEGKGLETMEGKGLETVPPQYVFADARQSLLHRVVKVLLGRILPHNTMQVANQNVEADSRCQMRFGARNLIVSIPTSSMCGFGLNATVPKYCVLISALFQPSCALLAASAAFSTIRAPSSLPLQHFPPFVRPADS
jgi:hypothetical protein